jgi:hypothetical protein
MMIGRSLFTNRAQVQKLRRALEEYENDKWRLIAAKVGNGFSPTACQDKIEELEAQEQLEDGESRASQQESPGSVQQRASPTLQTPLVRTKRAASTASSPSSTSARLL